MREYLQHRRAPVLPKGFVRLSCWRQVSLAMPDSMIYMPSPTWSSRYIAERFLKRRTAIRSARTSNLLTLSSERPFNRAKFRAVILPGGLTERPLMDAGRLDLFLAAIERI